MNFKNPEKKSLLVLMSVTLLLLFACAGFVSAACTGTITVVSPNGGESLSGTQTITWSGVNGNCDSANDKIMIYLYDKSAHGYNPITVNLPANTTTSYSSWDTSGSVDANSEYKIYIELSSNSSNYDFSDNFFTIDNSPSSGGSISYSDGYYTSESVALTINNGTDSQSGVASTEVFRV